MGEPYKPGDWALPVSIIETLETKYGVNLSGCIIYSREDFGVMSLPFVVKGSARYALLTTWDMTPASPTPSACSLLWVGRWNGGKWETVPALSGGAKTE